MTTYGKDHTFDAQYVQDPLHKLLYAGRLFCFGHIAEAVADDAALKVVIDARSKDFNMNIGFSFFGDGHVRAYAISSYTAGAAFNPANNYSKFQGVNSITALVKTQPTSINVHVSSTPLWSQLVPGGTKKNVTGAQAAPEEHQIIGAGGIVLFELTNKSGGASDIGFDMIGHETVIHNNDDPT